MQETFLRWQAADVARVEVPEAWLTKVLTNLCLNQLTSARARRETYVGQWLPESRCSPGTRCSAPRRRPSSASRSPWRSSPCWSGSHRASGRCTSCVRPSATRTGRSPRSSTSRRTPASRPCTGPGSTSRGQGPYRGRRGRGPADRRRVPRGGHQRPDRTAGRAAHPGRRVDRRRRREGAGPCQGVRGRPRRGDHGNECSRLRMGRPLRTIFACSFGTRFGYTRTPVSVSRWRGRSGAPGSCPTTWSVPVRTPARPAGPFRRPPDCPGS